MESPLGDFVCFTYTRTREGWPYISLVLYPQAPIPVLLEAVHSTLNL